MKDIEKEAGPIHFYLISKKANNDILLHKTITYYIRVFLVAQLVKNPPAMQETQVQFLDGEDPLEKEMAAHSSIPVWKIPWREEPGRLQSMGLQRVRHDLVTKPPHYIRTFE